MTWPTAHARLTALACLEHGSLPTLSDTPSPQPPLTVTWQWLLKWIIIKLCGTPWIRDSTDSKWELKTFACFTYYNWCSAWFQFVLWEVWEERNGRHKGWIQVTGFWSQRYLMDLTEWLYLFNELNRVTWSRSFSSLSLLTFQVKQFFVVQGCSVPCMICVTSQGTVEFRLYPTLTAQSTWRALW